MTSELADDVPRAEVVAMLKAIGDLVGVAIADLVEIARAAPDGIDDELQRVRDMLRPVADLSFRVWRERLEQAKHDADRAQAARVATRRQRRRERGGKG